MYAASSINQQLLLLSELFPPAVGGSAVLFGEIYSRLGDTTVAVVTDGIDMVACGLGIRSRRSVRRYFKLARSLRLWRPGVSMIHCGRALPEGLAALLSKWTGGPHYACWAHGEDIATALTSRELTLLMRMVYAGADVILANSVSTRGMLRELGIAADRIEIVYPGVDTRRFRPDIDATDLRRQIAPHCETVVLSVGRLQTRKGHDLMIQAMQVLTRSQHRSLRYVIVGDGPERHRLEELVDRCGVRSAVTFCGEVPAELLPQYFAACDIFVLPNRIDQGDVEGFGIVFLEAAASGKPAVGGRSGGVPEAVAEGVSGLLVSGSDLEELAGAVARLIDSESLRRSLGAAGRARVVREFTWEYAAQRVATVHRRITNGDRRERAIIERRVAHERKIS